MGELQRTKEWFDKADEKGVDVQMVSTQIRCHIEEFREMIETLSILIGNKDNGQMNKLIEELETTRKAFKAGKYNECIECLLEEELTGDAKRAKIALIDSLGDQIVTSTGVLNRINVDATEALKRVNDSNYSKFDKDGNPVYKPDGKIGRSELYFEPDFEDLV